MDKNTHELRVGDIVVTHGMRCLIDKPLAVSNSHSVNEHSPTLYTQALVLNRDDVPSEVVPLGWTRNWQRNDRPADNGEHRWTIQGNGLARWYVEESA